jgi:hypothetical protein
MNLQGYQSTQPFPQYADPRPQGKMAGSLEEVI